MYLPKSSFHEAMFGPLELIPAKTYDAEIVSQPERQESSEQVHRPVHHDHPRKTAGPQIDELEDYDQGQELQETKCYQVPIEYQREHAVLKCPPETDQRYRRPRASRQGLETGCTIGLVDDFFRWRPNQPKHRQAVDYRPGRKVTFRQ